MRFFLVLLASAGCSHSNAAPDALPDAKSITATFTQTLSDYDSGAPVAGAQVCAIGVVGGSDCVTTAVDGSYTIEFELVPGETRMSSLVTASGYLGRENLLYQNTNSPDFFWEESGLRSNADATQVLVADGGFTYPTSSTGFIQLNVLSGTNPVHATAALVGSAATPVYAGSDGYPDSTAVDTAQGGFAYFGNLSPGIYPVDVQAAGMTCSVLVDGGTINGVWPPAGSETLDVQVVGGAMTTELSVNCQ